MPEQIELELKDLKSKWFDSCRRQWRPLFEWLWRESASRCPYIRLVQTERYLEFVVDDDRGTNHESVVALIELQETGIRIGFYSGLDLSGLDIFKPLSFWNTRIKDFIVLTKQDPQILKVICMAYQKICRAKGIISNIVESEPSGN